MEINYEEKYLKYKNKYLELKKEINKNDNIDEQEGGVSTPGLYFIQMQ